MNCIKYVVKGGEKVKNYIKAAKSDGYIKNQRKRLKVQRGYILLKFLIVIAPLALFLAVASVGTLNTPSPEKWKHEEITYKDISWEIVRFSKRASHAYVLNTEEDGQFIIPLGINEIDAFSQQLVSGQKYHIVYTGNYFNSYTIITH